MRLFLSRLRPIITYETRRFSSRMYTKKHEWLTLVQDKLGRVGISDHAQEALGDVVHVQVPETGQKFEQFDEVGAIESVKAASELMTPVSGKISSVNNKLEDKPGLVNSDCYGEGWLFEIELKDPKELENLLNEGQYKKYLENSDE